ncbi:MAG: hypothetical protein CL912_18390 [Deltaproteobacteria bacterium]|nr:hypothetical protein [Deltaproteobacteria bacterium]
MVSFKERHHTKTTKSNKCGSFHCTFAKRAAPKRGRGDGQTRNSNADFKLLRAASTENQQLNHDYHTQDAAQSYAIHPTGKP